MSQIILLTEDLDHRTAVFPVRRTKAIRHLSVPAAVNHSAVLQRYHSS